VALVYMNLKLFEKIFYLIYFIMYFGGSSALWHFGLGNKKADLMIGCLKSRSFAYRPGRIPSRPGKSIAPAS